SKAVSPSFAFRLNNLANSLTKITLKKTLTSNYVYKAIDRIDYLACVIPDEYDLIKEKTNLHAEQAFYSYTNLKLLCGVYYGKEVTLGNKILCGNAATFSNNHADIIDLIATRGIENELIVPLSYGDTDDYASQVIAIGEKSLGGQFQPLTEFMSRDDYSKVLCSCGFMVMNNKRQEAVGNIILGLYLGMKVFLNEKSVVLKFLRGHGFIIYSFQKDFNKEELIALTAEEINLNRKKLAAYWGVEATEKRLQTTIRMLNERAERTEK
ncbi:MAG: TDP-N-acetylfucosamine:lipid II N-acetylfucosaminyltransferase, partial [Cyclobacteriaceae bacterium]